jgi:hypothetical protein
VGCFKYSPVEGATANELSGSVAPEVMEERHARFMERAAAISEKRMAAKVGTEITVLVDHVDGAKAVARTAGDAPEIDGVVNVKKAKSLRAGVRARADHRRRHLRSAANPCESRARHSRRQRGDPRDTSLRAADAVDHALARALRSQAQPWPSKEHR